MAMIKAVIFDLDGTLLNTIDDISDSLNIALAVNGFSKHTVDEAKMFVGSGVDIMVRRALGKTSYKPKQFGEIKKKYMAEYTARQTRKTKVYDGLIEVIDELRRLGIKTAVLSNKPQQDTLKTVAHYFTLARFDLVFGQREGIPIKPDPTALNAMIKELGLAKEECVFVGDSDVDMKTAGNAAMKKIGVLWGFRDRPALEENKADHIIENPADIVAIVKK